MKTSFKYSLEGQESERLIFRKIEESDFETWLTFIQYPESVKYIFSQSQLQITNPIERCKIWFKRVFDRYGNNFCDSLISMIHVDNTDSAKVAICNGMHLEKTTNSNGDLVNIFGINKT